MDKELESLFKERKDTPSDIYVVYPFWSVVRFFRNLPRDLKWWIQRRVRGYSDCDIWSMDTYILEKLQQMLPKFIENCHGYPHSYGKWEDWKKDLKSFKESVDFCLQEPQMDNVDTTQDSSVTYEALMQHDKILQKHHKNITDFLEKNFFNLWD